MKGRRSNMTLKVSDRDKKLLLVLLIVIVIAGSVKLFDILSTNNQDYNSELRTLKNKYTSLNVMNMNRENYLLDTEVSLTVRDALLAGYNTNITQEQVLIFLGMVEKNTGVWLKQMSFTNVDSMYTFGTVTSSNPDTSGEKVYSSDYKGISTQLSLSYECLYEDFKKVLTYLEEFGKKVTVNNVSFSYSESTDIVSGTMQVTLYAITGSDRPVEDVFIKDVPVGTDNIFSSDTFKTITSDSTYRDKIITDYDLFLIMNQVGSDMDTVAVGQAGDPSNETVVTSDTEGVENITIEVSGEAGSYKVKYKVGSSAYPADNYNAGAPLVCGDTLDLLMISKPRMGDKDNSLANVTIVNNSDLPLNVAVINDDIENPRIKIEKTEGVVLFFTE